MKKEVLRKILSLIIAFSATMCIFLAGVLAALSIVVSQPCLSAVLKSDKYLDSAEEEILFELRSLAAPGGLPDDFFSDGLSRDTMRKNIDIAIVCATEHTPFKSVDFLDEMREKIYAYAKTEGIDVSESQISNSIETMLRYFDTTYKTYICYTPLRAIGSVRRVMFPFGVIDAVALAVIGAVLYLIVRKMNDKNSKLYSVSVFGGSAIMLFTVPAIILLSGTVKDINISSPSAYYLMSTVISVLLFLLIVFAVLIIIFMIIKKLIAKRQ